MSQRRNHGTARRHGFRVDRRAARTIDGWIIRQQQNVDIVHFAIIILAAHDAFDDFDAIDLTQRLFGLDRAALPAAMLDLDDEIDLLSALPAQCDGFGQKVEIPFPFSNSRRSRP